TAKGDSKELAKFLADDFVSVSVLGKYGKADNLTSCQRHRLSDWTVNDPLVVRTSKDTAVLTYLYDCKVLSADGTLLETRTSYRVTAVWANRDGGWVMVFAHDDHGRKPVGRQGRGIPDLEDMSHLGRLYRLQTDGLYPKAFSPDGTPVPLNLKGE